MDNASWKELALVAAVGWGLAAVAKRVPVLKDSSAVTGITLYTLGFYVATRRPEGGYNLKMLTGD